MLSRHIYTSSSGDSWDLVREDGTGRLYVKHTPNLASGGMGSQIDLATFLGRNSHSAECAALLKIIGTLVDEPTAAGPIHPADSASGGEGTGTSEATRIYVEAAKREGHAAPDNLPGDVEEPG